MPLELAGRLKKAVDASNVRFEPDDVQDRLHVAMAPHAGVGTTVADVLRLEYRVGGALAALLPESTMEQYAQVSTFVWKLKTMEFNLQRAFLVRVPLDADAAHVPRSSLSCALCRIRQYGGAVLGSACAESGLVISGVESARMQALRRIEVMLRRALRSKVASSHEMWHLLKQAHRVRGGLHGFCQTLQTYVMFDAIEGSWHTLAPAVQQARPTCCTSKGAFALRVTLEVLASCWDR
jgi:Gamma tubulin complex component C-terminal